MKRATWADVVLTFYMLIIVNVAILGWIVKHSISAVHKRLTKLKRCD
jgi:hypothetical protein